VQGRESFLRELREMVELLYNCPCIAMWVPFNEGWGQFDAAKALTMVESLDRTRSIDHASGWHDQGVGACRSEHVYFKAYRYKPDARGRAVLLSEYGGYRYAVEGHTQKRIPFGYKRCKDAQALLAAYTSLVEEQIIPAKKQGLAAAVYTQLSDVEGECNGLLTYDRKVKKLPEAALCALHRKLLEEEN